MNQDFRKSRLSDEDLELSDQPYTLLALLCKDEACAHVRFAKNGKCDKPSEPVEKYATRTGERVSDGSEGQFT